MRFYIVVTCEIECLAHGVNVSFVEKRENVHLKARGIGQKSKDFEDAIKRAVGKTVSDPDCDDAVHPIVLLGARLK
jgi:hypothetical protein